MATIQADRPLLGLQLYACWLTAVRPSDPPGSVDVQTTFALQAAESEAAAEEQMVGEYAGLYPVVDEWEIRCRAGEIDHEVLIEFAAEYATRLGIRVRRQNVR